VQEYDYAGRHSACDMNSNHFDIVAGADVLITLFIHPAAWQYPGILGIILLSGKGGPGN